MYPKPCFSKLSTIPSCFIFLVDFVDITITGIFVSDNFSDIDVGEYSAPEFSDVDSDGDLHFIVGVIPASTTYFWFNDGAGYYHFTIDLDNLKTFTDLILSS